MPMCNYHLITKVIRDLKNVNKKILRSAHQLVDRRAGQLHTDQGFHFVSDTNEYQTGLTFISVVLLLRYFFMINQLDTRSAKDTLAS